jgi:hypothetical protein
VLDAFCANGAFSFRALQASAREVVGLNAEPGRVDIANIVAWWERQSMREHTRVAVIEGHPNCSEWQTFVAAAARATCEPVTGVQQATRCSQWQAKAARSDTSW